MSSKAILSAGTLFDPQAFQIELEKIPSYDQFEVEQKHDGSIEFEGITQVELDAALATALASPTALPVEQVATRKAAATAVHAINDAYTESVDVLVAAYPNYARETWVYQVDEAWDIVDQKGRPTPFLDGMLTELSALGMTIDLLAQKIIAAEAGYKASIAPLEGKRQRLIAMIEAIDPLSPTAEADIAAIKWM